MSFGTDCEMLMTRAEPSAAPEETAEADRAQPPTTNRDANVCSESGVVHSGRRAVGLREVGEGLAIGLLDPAEFRGVAAGVRVRGDGQPPVGGLDGIRRAGEP